MTWKKNTKIIKYNPVGFSLFSVVFETRSHYAVQAELKLELFLPWPPQCWDYRCVPPGPASLVS
jgi:hypothetical protein